MKLTRKFLDWSQPCLLSAARHLIGSVRDNGRADLSNATVVLPSGRASRRLIELMVLEAESQALMLFPPRFITVAGLYSLLGVFKSRPASDIERRLAWAETLRDRAALEVRTLVPQPPQSEDTLKWLALGERFDQLFSETSAAMLSFDDVAVRCGDLPFFDDAERWRALSSLFEVYQAGLGECGLHDPMAAALNAARSMQPLPFEGRLALLAVADLPPILEKLLSRSNAQIEALIFAPESAVDAFDEFGRLITAEWVRRAGELEIRSDSVTSAYDAADCGARVLDALSALPGSPPPDAVTIGVAEPLLAPYLARALGACGVPVHNAAGTALGETPPLRVLEALRMYLETRSVAAVAALVRLPPVEAWIRSELTPAEIAALGGDLSGFLDRFHSRHLPSLCESAVGLGGDGTRLASIVERIDALARELAGSRRPLAAWAEPINKVLTSVFGLTKLNRAVPSDRLLIEICEQLHERLLCYRESPRSAGVELGGAEALGVLVRDLSSSAYPAEQREHSVEMLGWLELALDDAPHLIVAGMNEGLVPEALNADPFLPNALRAALGLLDNERRLARDAYALATMLRSKKSSAFIALRQGPRGEALLLSRLLYGSAPDETARRLKEFYRDRPRATGRVRQRTAAPFEIPIRPAPPARPIESLSITGFKDYLACPYRFYLKHVLRLETLDDRAVEMDGRLFGTVAHEALGAFASSEAAASDDLKVVERALRGALAECARTRFGSRPLPAVIVQLQQLELRLEYFARWQAQWASQGWRIKHSELDLPAESSLLAVDGRTLRVRGRVDRIDENVNDGAWAVFDYKLREEFEEPRAAHRKRSGVWVDLQLPLYRHFLRAAWPERSISVGYIALPQDSELAGGYLAGWQESDYESALACALEIARCVAAGNYWPPSERSGLSPEYDWLCGVGQFIQDEGEEACGDE